MCLVADNRAFTYVEEASSEAAESGFYQQPVCRQLKVVFTAFSDCNHCRWKPAFGVSVIHITGKKLFFLFCNGELFFFCVLSFFASFRATGEELGWRGYLREELDKKYSFFGAALIQGIIWTFWHTVLWFVDSDFTGFELVPYIVSNLLVMTSLVFVMNTVLEKHKNLIYSIVIHFTFNFIYCFLQVDIWFYALFSVVYVLIGAGFYLWRTKSVQERE